MRAADYGGRRRAAKRVRLGLIFLALAALVPGLWAWLAPRSFYGDFPGLGFAWVSIFPPYNEHLIRDVGAAHLGFGVLLGAAAIIMDRRLSQIALIAWLLFALPHFYFHITHAEWSRTGDKTQAIAMGLTVLLPLLLLPLSRRAERS